MLFLTSLSQSALLFNPEPLWVIAQLFVFVEMLFPILRESYKYLGHIISSNLADDADIMKQTRALYARANTIIRKFSSTSLSTKLLLFRAYCIPIYGCQLWCSMFQYSYRQLYVAYNAAFRQLLQEPRWCSASQLFVLNNVPAFSANIRKLVYSPYCSLRKSDNVLVQTACDRPICAVTPLFRRWRNLLV